MNERTGPSTPSPTDGAGPVRGRRDETLSSAECACAAGGADAAPRLPVGSAADAQADARSLNPTDSPCVALCSTLYDDVCRGCGRTVFEVANWVFMDEAEKREVWDRIRSQGFPRRRPATGRHGPASGTGE